MTIVKRVKRDLQPTISIELFDAWKALRRTGDPEAIALILGKSRPVIDKALNYGFVKDQAVIEGITKYYDDRNAKEASDAKRLTKKSKA